MSLHVAFPRKRLSPVLPLLVALLASAESRATGFFINQQSVPGLGRVDAGSVAAANELGTLFFNPAGMSELWQDTGRRSRVDVGVHVIAPSADLTDMGSTAATPGTLGNAVPFAGHAAKDPVDETPVVNVYYARQLRNERLTFGLRLNSPYGLATEYGPTWFGRYDTVEADLLTASVGVVQAYRVNDRLTIGGGVDIQYADADLSSAIPNPLVPGGPVAATDGRFDASGDDWGVGFNVGLLWHAGTAVRLGAHYRSGIDHDLSGSATTSGLTGPLADFNGSAPAATGIDLPGVAAVGFAYEPVDSRFVLYGDYTWYSWGDLETIDIELAGGLPGVQRPQGFRDTYSAAFGADFALSDRVTLRGGVKHDRTPTTDAYRDTAVADDDRLWIAIGATYARSARLSIDFALVHLIIDDTEVDVTRRFFDGTPLASQIRTRARVDSSANNLAVGFRWSF